MASRTKHDKGARRDEKSPEHFLDALTKEEKEAQLNKKMEEIRKRNEERQRRHAEIEADRKAAEQMGRAVSLKPTSPEVGGLMNRAKGSNTDQLQEYPEGGSKMRAEKHKSDGRSKPNQTNGRSRPASFKAEARTRSENAANDYRANADQGKDIKSKKADTASNAENNVFSNRKKQNDEQNKPTAMKGVKEKETPRNRSVGRGKHLTQMSQQKLKAEEYEKSKREATADALKAPPPDPGYKFLADPRREKSLPEPRGETTRRHPRNFGGTSFESVKNKIKAEKEKHGRFRDGPPQSEMDMTLQMTGRERREYAQWRAERERIDRERLQRQKSAEGTWKREWDVGKREQSPPTPPMSRKMEPGRRPAGRIGSGRFAAGEPDERLLKGQRDDASPGHGKAKRGRESVPLWSRGRGSESRGGHRGLRHSHSSSDSMENPDTFIDKNKQETNERSPKRFRLSSQGSDDGSRHVKQHNDKLVIQIDNEFASSKSPTSGSKPKFPDFSTNQGKDFYFKLPGSSANQDKFEGFHAKPSSRGDFRGSGRGGRGRGRGERRRSMDRKTGRSGRPGRGKTVTFQTQPVVHTPDLEWDHGPDLKQNGPPASDWKKELEEVSAKNWTVSEEAEKSWESDSASAEKTEGDGEYMEDHYIVEETYPQLKKKRSKTKKRKARVLLPKPKPKELTGFVDENGEPIDDKDGEWLDEEELETNEAEDDGEAADNKLHDSSAESLERFIQEHTLQLSIDEKTGDISLENSLPSSQQSGGSSAPSNEQSPHHRPSPPHKSSPSTSNQKTNQSHKPASDGKPEDHTDTSENDVQPYEDSSRKQTQDGEAEQVEKSEESQVGAKVDNQDETPQTDPETLTEGSSETANRSDESRQECKNVGRTDSTNQDEQEEERQNADQNEDQDKGEASSQVVAEDENVTQGGDDKEQIPKSTNDDTQTTETDHKTDNDVTDIKETSSGLNKGKPDVCPDTENTAENNTAGDGTVPGVEKCDTTEQHGALAKTSDPDVQESAADASNEQKTDNTEDVNPAVFEPAEVLGDKGDMQQEKDNNDLDVDRCEEVNNTVEIPVNEAKEPEGQEMERTADTVPEADKKTDMPAPSGDESHLGTSDESSPSHSTADNAVENKQSEDQPDEAEEAVEEDASSKASLPSADVDATSEPPDSTGTSGVEDKCKSAESIAFADGDNQPAPEASKQSTDDQTDVPQEQTAAPVEP